MNNETEQSPIEHLITLTIDEPVYNQNELHPEIDGTFLLLIVGVLVVTIINSFALGFVLHAAIIKRNEYKSFTPAPLPGAVTIADLKETAMQKESQDTEIPVPLKEGSIKGTALRAIDSIVQMFENNDPVQKIDKEVTKKTEEKKIKSKVMHYPDPSEIRKQKEKSIEDDYYADKAKRVNEPTTESIFVDSL